jgi:hypothetical protein
MGIISGLHSAMSGNSVRKYQKRAVQSERNLALSQSIRNYRAMIAAGRTAQADSMVSGVAQGLDSSASQGNRQSLDTQFKTNKTDFNTEALLQLNINKSNDQAAAAAIKAAKGASFAALADKFISFAGAA